MIFRRPDSVYAEAAFRLYGLKDDVYYEFTDADSKEVFLEKGSELKKNLNVKMNVKRSSKLMFYRRKQEVANAISYLLSFFKTVFMYLYGVVPKYRLNVAIKFEVSGNPHCVATVEMGVW